MKNIGLVLGVNAVAACLMMSGCKAVKPDAGAQTPAVTPVAEPAQPSVQPANTEPVEVKTEETKPVEPVAVEPVKPEVKPEAETTEYVVRNGDMISKISARYNIRISAIKAANPGINIDKIRVGQKIKLPGKVDLSKAPAPVAKKPAKSPVAKKGAASTKAPAATKTVKEYKPYTGATAEYAVKNGDFLGKIAQNYGISVRQLKELNGLAMGPKGNALKIDQKLKVPASKVTAETAAAPVEKSVEAVTEPAPAPVATPVTEPAAATPAPVTEPAVVEPAPAPATESASAASATAPVRTYTCKEGDELVQLALEMNITPSELLDANSDKISSAYDKIPAGTVLKLPANAKDIAK